MPIVWENRWYSEKERERKKKKKLPDIIPNIIAKTVYTITMPAKVWLIQMGVEDEKEDDGELSSSLDRE